MLLNALYHLDGMGDAPRLAETILALMPEASVMVVDTDLRVAVVRGTVYERHGYDVDSVIGRDLHDLTPATVWGRVGPHWRAALAGSTARPTWSRSTVRASTGCISRL